MVPELHLIIDKLSRNTAKFEFEKAISTIA